MLTRHHSSQGESQQGEQAAGAAAEKEKRRTIEREPPAWAWPTCRPCSRVASRFDGPPWLGSIDESVWRSSVPQIESFGTFGSLLVPFGGLWMWTAGVAGHHIEYWAPPRRDDGTAYRFGRVPLRRRCSRLRDQLRGAVVWTWDWTPLSPPAGPTQPIVRHQRAIPASHLHNLTISSASNACVPCPGDPQYRRRGAPSAAPPYYGHNQNTRACAACSLRILDASCIHPTDSRRTARTFKSGFISAASSSSTTQQLPTGGWAAVTPQITNTYQHVAHACALSMQQNQKRTRKTERRDDGTAVELKRSSLNQQISKETLASQQRQE